MKPGAFFYVISPLTLREVSNKLTGTTYPWIFILFIPRSEVQTLTSSKFIFICCFLLVHFSSAAEEITLAQDPWPPITSENTNNEALATVIVTTAFRTAGYNPTVKTIPWKRALLEVKTLKSDAIVAAYYNDERSQVYNYSAPYLITPILFLKRKDSDIHYQSLEDLRGYRIGYVRGTSSGNTFDQADFLNKVELNDPSTVIRMLYNLSLIHI